MVGRKPLGRSSLHARVARDTAEKLKEIALMYGYVYDNEGATGQLLDAIANGELLLIPSKSYSRKHQKSG
jgi:hypothetical protein